MNALPWTIAVSFVGALLALLTGGRSPSTARWVALLTAIAPLGLSLSAATHLVPGPALQTLIDQAWIPSLGVRFHLAADGISLTLLVLTGIAATAGVLF